MLGVQSIWSIRNWISNSDTYSSISSPTTAFIVSSTANMVGLVAGFHHSCVLTSMGAVYCWGRNNVGQLGDGSATSVIRHTATVVCGMASGITKLMGKDSHTCGLSSGGSIYCWGLNNILFCFIYTFYVNLWIFLLYTVLRSL